MPTPANGKLEGTEPEQGSLDERTPSARTVSRRLSGRA